MFHVGAKPVRWLTDPQRNQVINKLQELTGLKWEYHYNLVVDRNEFPGFRATIDTLNPLEQNRYLWESKAKAHGLYIITDFIREKFKRRTDIKSWICYEVNFQKLMATNKEIFQVHEPSSSLTLK